MSSIDWIVRSTKAISRWFSAYWFYFQVMIGGIFYQQLHGLQLDHDKKNKSSKQGLLGNFWLGTGSVHHVSVHFSICVCVDKHNCSMYSLFMRITLNILILGWVWLFPSLGILIWAPHFLEQQSFTMPMVTSALPSGRIDPWMISPYLRIQPTTNACCLHRSLRRRISNIKHHRNPQDVI